MKNRLTGSNSKVVFLLLFLTIASLVNGQDVQVANTTNAGNPMFNAIVNTILIAAMLLFVFVIASLSMHISTISKIWMKKIKENKDKVGMLVFLVLAGSSFTSHAQGSDEHAFLFKPVPSDTLTLVFLIGVFSILLFVTFMLSRSLAQMLNILYGREKTKEQVKEEKEFFWKRWIDKMNSAVPIERERDVMLDHDYDGIKELDNSLPPWWKYGFYVTIVFSFLYLINYHVGGNGLSSGEEYMEEVKQAEALKINLAANVKDAIDENTAVFLSDAASIADGRKIFEQNCVTCHGNNAEGLAGPNLTDKFWLHGGGIKNVFTVITNGVPGKAMMKWRGILKPKEVELVASYVWSLQAKPVAGKAPEGTEYIPAPETKPDSAAIKMDTTVKVLSKK